MTKVSHDSGNNANPPRMRFEKLMENGIWLIKFIFKFILRIKLRGDFLRFSFPKVLIKFLNFNK